MLYKSACPIWPNLAFKIKQHNFQATDNKNYDNMIERKFTHPSTEPVFFEFLS